MPTTSSMTADEAKIRELTDDWANALRDKDIERLMSHYAPDVVVFGVMPPLQYTGAALHRNRWEQSIAAFMGPIGYEIRDLNVTTAGDIAFSHSVNRISGKMKSGETGGNWMRVTVCFRKIDGRWLTTHEHVSVPFDMNSGKASLDLEP